MISIKNEFIELEILRRGVTFKTFKLLKDNINIITAYENLEDYKNNEVYLGACIGPLAGRTAIGMYDLDLDQNDGIYHLHGGKNGISNQIFDVEEVDDGAIFTLNSDGIDYTITVSLMEHTMKIDFLVIPENERPINMTNHMYFNLMGSNHIKDHRLKVEASEISLHNKDMFNDGTIIDVEDTVFDLQTLQSMTEVLKGTHPQFTMTRHIDHSFLGQDLVLEAGEKRLEVHGTMPAMHIYLANFFDESFKDEHGRLAGNNASIAIEPQYIPNDSKMPVYSKENPYEESITYTLK